MCRIVPEEQWRAQSPGDYLPVHSAQGRLRAKTPKCRKRKPVIPSQMCGRLVAGPTDAELAVFTEIFRNDQEAIRLRSLEALFAPTQRETTDKSVVDWFNRIVDSTKKGDGDPAALRWNWIPIEDIHYADRLIGKDIAVVELVQSSKAEMKVVRYGGLVKAYFPGSPRQIEIEPPFEAQGITSFKAPLDRSAGVLQKQIFIHLPQWITIESLGPQWRAEQEFIDRLRAEISKEAGPAPIHSLLLGSVREARHEIVGSAHSTLANQSLLTANRDLLARYGSIWKRPKTSEELRGKVVAVVGDTEFGPSRFAAIVVGVWPYEPEPGRIVIDFLNPGVLGTFMVVSEDFVRSNIIVADPNGALR